LVLLVLAGCGAHTSAVDAPASFAPACESTALRVGSRCVSQLPARAQLASASRALTDLRVDEAKAMLDHIPGPLEHDSHVVLWEQRGISAAYVDDASTAKAAFDMLLALDPAHLVSYTLSPKATFLFEDVRNRRDRRAPALDVTWPRGGQVGKSVPVAVEVVSSPKSFVTSGSSHKPRHASKCISAEAWSLTVPSSACTFSTSG